MNNLSNAVDEVTEAIRNDQGLYIAYQANIAMAFKDEWSRVKLLGISGDSDLVHEVANQAAKNFLDLWIKPLPKLS